VSLDFTAIDFETANPYRGSPCPVGLVKVRDGQIVDQAGTLIRPRRGGAVLMLHCMRVTGESLERRGGSRHD
jgi:DNA polymerase-3 subunit epsilon